MAECCGCGLCVVFVSLLLCSGVGPDARVLVKSGRKFAETYRLRYGDAIPVREMVRHLASVMQHYTQSGGVRPFGVSLLVAGFDDGPHLYQVDPSGAYWAWKASAIGKNMTNAKTFLEKRYIDEEMGIDDAIHTALLTLREGFDGQVTGENVEVAVVDADRKFRKLMPSEIADFLLEVE
jgi:20S proteasome subunit alpha 2